MAIHANHPGPDTGSLTTSDSCIFSGSLLCIIYELQTNAKANENP